MTDRHVYDNSRRRLSIIIFQRNDHHAWMNCEIFFPVCRNNFIFFLRSKRKSKVVSSTISYLWRIVKILLMDDDVFNIRNIEHMSDWRIFIFPITNFFRKSKFYIRGEFQFIHRIYRFSIRLLDSFLDFILWMENIYNLICSFRINTNVRYTRGYE